VKSEVVSVTSIVDWSVWIPCLAQEPSHNCICLFWEYRQGSQAGAIVAYAAVILLDCGVSCSSVGSRSNTSAAEESVMKKKVIKIQFGFYLAIGKFYWIPLSF
jgi:hypothetical protein